MELFSREQKAPSFHLTQRGDMLLYLHKTKCLANVGRRHWRGCSTGRASAPLLMKTGTSLQLCVCMYSRVWQMLTRHHLCWHIIYKNNNNKENLLCSRTLLVKLSEPTHDESWRSGTKNWGTNKKIKKLYKLNTSCRTFQGIRFTCFAVQ